MASATPDSKVPAFIGLALVGAGLAMAIVFGFTGGTIAGGLIAALGVIFGCLGIWKGIQQDTQGTLATSVMTVILALGVGALLIVLRIIDMIRH